MKLVIASNNKNKIKEIKKILGDSFDEIVSLAEAGIDHETVEDGETFMENAIKKAREIAEIANSPALADDSGLCVDALDGAPGIYSARFCGYHGNDEANNALLLEKLDKVKDRGAHYTAAIALVYPSGESVTAEGYMYGEILTEPRGNGGFGYDPLFLPAGMDKSVAEITDDEKNKISHRAAALNDLLLKLNGRS